jgi:hypothetical protein
LLGCAAAASAGPRTGVLLRALLGFQAELKKVFEILFFLFQKH